MDRLRPKIKIKDIAEKSGVSAGTIDRVLHHRGNVSEETRKKVQDVLDEINYVPNLYASALASKKVFVFHAVIPQYQEGEYWELVLDGIQKGVEELSDFKVITNVSYFEQFNPDLFSKAMDQVIEKAPDGVILAPLHKPVALKYIDKFDKLGISYVFLDSNIENTQPLAFYGQDPLQSAHVAGKLLFSLHPDIEEIAIFNISQAGQASSNQINMRTDSFMSYVKKWKKRCKLHRVILDVCDPAGNEEKMKKLFGEHPKIKGTLVFSSRAYVVAEFLEKYQFTHITMIGYDLLDRNVKYLKNDTISYLIAQRPEEQGYRSIKALSDHFLFKKEIRPIHFAPIDILTQENIDFYMDF